MTGVYSVTNLEPVVYRVVVELPGFKKAVVEPVKVDTAATATLNVTLRTGGVEAQVTVTAEAPWLKAGSGTTGQTITERHIFYDASANSIRHAAYVSVNRRVTNGLAFTANYTFGRSMDDASDASPDKNALATGSTQGHATFGAPRSADWSLSTFDVRHNFSSTFLYELPFGARRRFLTGARKPIAAVVGDWTISGVLRLQGGYPFLPKISDSNRLSADQTHTVRPNLIPGVPLLNPLWTRDCPISNVCEPYVNGGVHASGQGHARRRAAVARRPGPRAAVFRRVVSEGHPDSRRPARPAPRGHAERAQSSELPHQPGRLRDRSVRQPAGRGGDHGVGIRRVGPSE